MVCVPPKCFRLRARSNTSFDDFSVFLTPRPSLISFYVLLSHWMRLIVRAVKHESGLWWCLLEARPVRDQFLCFATSEDAFVCAHAVECEFGLILMSAWTHALTESMSMFRELEGCFLLRVRGQT